MSESYSERIARLKNEKAAEQAAATLVQPLAEESDDSLFYEESLGDVPESRFTRSEADTTIDGIIERLTVEEAYKKFIRKPWVTRGGGGSNHVRFSCPMPEHPDREPSASVNLTNQTWFCHGTCDRGGDALDVAAIGLGYDLNSYKAGKTFVELRKRIASAFGYTELPRVIGQKEAKWTLVAPAADSPTPVEESSPSTPSASPSSPPLPGALKLSPAEMIAKAGAAKPSPVASVTAIASAPSFVEEMSEETAAAIIEESDPDHDFKYPSLNWRSFVPEGTFLYEYLKGTSDSPWPDEYDFWNGLLGIGFILGKEVTLNDDPDVNGNLFICTVGRTGEGKSQAARKIKQILRDVLPFEYSDPSNNGVHMVPTPNSDVFLIQEFDRRIADPGDPKIEYRIPVRGLVDFSEMVGLTSKLSGEHGGRFRAVVLNFYDCEQTITTGAMGSGVKDARDAYCAVTATTQLKEIKNLLTDSDASSGLLNRFIFSMGPPRIRDIMSVDKADLEVARTKFQELKAFWSLHSASLRFTDEGLETFRDLWNTRGRPMKSADSSDLLARLDLTMKKIVLLLAANQKAVEVDASIVRQAFAVLDYLGETYRAIGARIGVSKQSELEIKVTNAITSFQARNPGQYPTVTQINQLLAKKIPAKELHNYLKTMTELGLIQFIPKPSLATKAGRPADRYRYVG